MATLKIVIGAAVDPGVNAAFARVTDAARRAQENARKQTEKGAKEEGRTRQQRTTSEEKLREREAKAAERAAKKAEDAARKLAEKEKLAAAKREAEHRKASAALAKLDDDALIRNIRRTQKEHDEYRRSLLRDIREHERAERAKTRTEEREAKARKRLAERERKEEEQRRKDRSNFVSRFFGNDGWYGKKGQHPLDRTAQLAGMAAVPFGIAGGLAVSAMSSVASGMGLQLDLSSHIARNAELEAMATAVSNSAYMPNEKGRNSVRQNIGTLISESRSVGNATGYSANEVMAGFQAFTAKTGDLATARDVMKELAAFSKATGSNLDDMANAAGDVANVIGDIPGKADAVKRVMAAIAGQGKLGAVEMRDLATQMAKVAAGAPMFNGSREENIIKFGALVQLAKKLGGAAKATQAATSAMGFTNTLRTPARIAAFREKGIEVFDKQTGKLRDMDVLIKEALTKTGGNAEAFKKLFANVIGDKAPTALMNIYNDAGRGEAGIKAVTEELDRFKKATMDAAEVQESLRRSLNTTESKAQILNNKFQEAADSISQSLKEPVSDLALAFSGAAKDIAKAINWITGRGDGPSDDEVARANRFADDAGRNFAFEAAQSAANGGAPELSENSKAMAAENLAILVKKRDAARKRGKEALDDWRNWGMGSDKYIEGTKAFDEADELDSQIRAIQDALKNSQDELYRKLMQGEALPVRVTNPTEPKDVPKAGANPASRSGPRR